MMTIAGLDIEIGRLRQEVYAVERAPESFDEVWPAVEAELAKAEAMFHRLGPQLSHRAVAVLPEYLFQQRQIAIGAALVANRKAIVDSERSRVRAATEGGMSAPDRQRRLAQLRAAVLRASAQKEMALRSIEREGEFLPRDVHPELAIFTCAEVERLAA